MFARRLRLAITERAADDLLRIERYTVEQWGVDQALEYEAAIHNALDARRSQPKLGMARDDLGPGLRSHPVLSHIIVYRVEENVVVVKRIVHQRMDILRNLFS